MTHSPSLASPVKERYGFPQAATTPMDSQPLLEASRAVTVTPIAQMWKLRRRQVRAGTLGPVLHPQGLLFSVTCGVRVARGPRCLPGHIPSLSQRHSHSHWYPQNTQLSHSFQPNPAPHDHGPAFIYLTDMDQVSACCIPGTVLGASLEVNRVGPLFQTGAQHPPHT